MEGRNYAAQHALWLLMATAGETKIFQTLGAVFCLDRWDQQPTIHSASRGWRVTPTSGGERRVTCGRASEETQERSCAFSERRQRFCRAAQEELCCSAIIGKAWRRSKQPKTHSALVRNSKANAHCKTRLSEEIRTLPILRVKRAHGQKESRVRADLPPAACFPRGHAACGAPLPLRRRVFRGSFNGPTRGGSNRRAGEPGCLGITIRTPVFNQGRDVRAHTRQG
ncbi:hypothetical protein AAFF_G00399360 [Aldrovandia affinis]|uniref:Uncharacterized protein n=1 Tax=Aldrovandia affinis TaxID=143900 RepID=A0AAD7WKH8_9TELE|nr:hypothetical protein AAFF_G00399360 [Aldrovandia affinis]